jgi:glycosyltransferase involved in cell wall biosynthesis
MVSVIVPAYRASRYIAATLTSAFAQTYAPIEVIVVNDGSPDRDALLAALTPFRDRLVLIEQDNAGAGAARNAGLAVARGEYVAFLDADDRWLPEFLQSQIDYLSRHPGCDLVYADARITGDTPLAGRTFMDTTPSDGPVTFSSLLSQRCTVITSSVVARRDTIAAAGGFDAGLRRGQDFDLWLRLAHLGARIGYRRDVLIDRHVLADGLSADPITELQRAIHVLHGIRTKVALDVENCARLERRVTELSAALELERGKRCLRGGRVEVARQHFLRSQALSPQWKLRGVLAVMTIAPRLFQRAYNRLRPPTTAEMLAGGLS